MITDILAVVLALIGVIVMFYYRQQHARSVGKEYFYGIVGLFLLLALLAVLIDFYTYAPAPVASSVWAANIVSNTVYQNGNASTLYLYAVTQGSSAAYIGSNANALVLVANQDAVLSGATGSVVYNLTETVVVPPYYYYRFNYAGITAFSGEYSNTT